MKKSIAIKEIYYSLGVLHLGLLYGMKEKQFSITIFGEFYLMRRN